MEGGRKTLSICSKYGSNLCPISTTGGDSSPHSDSATACTSLRHGGGGGGGRRKEGEGGWMKGEEGHIYTCTHAHKFVLANTLTCTHTYIHTHTHTQYIRT